MVSREVLYDDMDETMGAERITVSVNGKTWELDLARANRERFDRALKPFLDAARPVGRHGKTKQAGPTPADIRRWAAENGVAVAAKGKIPNEVLVAYQAAQTS